MTEHWKCYLIVQYDEWWIVTYFDFFSIDVDGFHGKIHTNCITMSLFILARFKSLNNACFSRATVSNQHNFEQIIKIFIVRRGK